MFVNLHLCSNCAVLIFVKDCESFFECGQLLQETSIYSWKSSQILIPCKRSTGHRLQLNKGGLTSEVSDSKIFFLSASLKAVIWKYAIPMNFFSRPICTFLLVSFCRPIWTFLLVSFSLLIWTFFLLSWLWGRAENSATARGSFPPDISQSVEHFQSFQFPTQ